MDSTLYFFRSMAVSTVAKMAMTHSKENRPQPILGYTGRRADRDMTV